MKTIITTLLLAFIVSAGQAQKTDSLKIDTNVSICGNKTTGGITLTNPHWQTVKIAKDTVPCYFQVITGIVKGNLMGTWIKGWIIKPKGYGIFIQSENYEEYREKYLYPDKKTLVKKPVINHYTAND